jgi:ATP/maltotriose-dependent transcriptional regulator MalT
VAKAWPWILYNGVGRYRDALSSAVLAGGQGSDIFVAGWALPERLEAAVRTGQLPDAKLALEEFQQVANVSNSPWARGLALRSEALVTDGPAAEGLYRDSIESLGRTELRVEFARAHLLFGEWLRRENRRVEARSELRTAYELFLAMPADGFAERARRELLATGERVRAHRGDTSTQLSSQELHIALLARDGRTNPEIATELFISARTVEWHLRKVFAKLGITSRRELRKAPLPTAAQPK